MTPSNSDPRNTRKYLITHINFGMLRDIVFGLCPSYTRYVLTPVMLLSFGLVGCVGAGDPDHQSQSSTAASAAADEAASRCRRHCRRPRRPPTGCRGRAARRVSGQPGKQRRPLRRAWATTSASRSSPGTSGCRCARAWWRRAPARSRSPRRRRLRAASATPGCPGEGGAGLEQEACCSKCLYSGQQGQRAARRRRDLVVLAPRRGRGGRRAEGVRGRPARLLGHHRLLDRARTCTSRSCSAAPMATASRCR